MQVFDMDRVMQCNEISIYLSGDKFKLLFRVLGLTAKVRKRARENTESGREGVESEIG